MSGNQITAQEKTALMPQTLDEKMKMATILAKSGLVPNTLNTAEKVLVALQTGHELGLSPMVSVNNVIPINGKPTLSADIMYALARNNPEYGGIEWKQRSAQKAEVVITRITAHGAAEKFTGYFDIEMAKQAELTGKDNYKKYPDRMMRARALSRACKEAFPDVFAGIFSSEEAETFDPGELCNVTEHPADRGTSAEDLANDLAAQAENAKTEEQPEPEKTDADDGLF
ncbi:MAG: recombinase RecT [Treponema sp.]|jgi:hypothetical protein|nr:recombinase RecT [Treponema sp.]